MAHELAGYRPPPGGDPPRPGATPTGVLFVFDVLRRWWIRLVGFGLVLGGVAAGLGYALWSPTYESEAVLIVNPSLVFSQDHFDSLQFSRSQIEVIKSPAVLEPALEDE